MTGGGASGRRVADRAMRLLSQGLVRVFFRSIEVEPGEGLPAGGVLVVSNHTNGLVDGLLLIAELPRYPRPVGKSTLQRIVPLVPLLRLAGMVPIHRAQDGATTANDAAFATCRRLLADGGVVAIFPEGISHDEASLQPLRTGAARIALGTLSEPDHGSLHVVPVGLSFDAKARFRSRALLTVGRPIDVAPWAAEAEAVADDPEAGRALARRLTEDLAAALSAVSPDFDDRSDARRLERIADVLDRSTGGPLPTEGALADRRVLAQRLARIDDAELAPLLAADAAYERDLVLLGLADAHLAATVRRTRVWAAVAWSALTVFVGLPGAAAGFVLHVVPYLVVKQAGRLPKNEGVRSTVKVVGCLFLFGAEYAVVGWQVGRRKGVVAGAAAAVAAPLAGYGTVRVVERAHAAGGLLRAARTLRSRRSFLASVRAHRAAVVEAAAAVLDVEA